MAGLCLLSCQSQLSSPSADLVLQGATIYTVADGSPQAEAVAVRDDRIVFVGSQAEAAALIGPQTQVLDLQGQTVLPGLIESHGHFLGMGRQASIVDLTQIKTYQGLLDSVKAATLRIPKGEWIVGRGWHQSKWPSIPEPVVEGFQTHTSLSAVSPDHPVVLEHASGHGVFANARAMAVAGITDATSFDNSGEIIRDATGKATGIFTEAASGLIERHVPESTPESQARYLQKAIDVALENGITSFQDAGSNQEAIDLYTEFVAAGKMDIRLWAMLSGSDSALLEAWYTRGPFISTPLTIRSIKLYADGALGSRGAWLLEPYSDRHKHVGNPILPMPYIGKVAHAGMEHGFQVCTHAIGDRANREVLDRYQAAIKAHPEQAKDHRYRIEHAQHLHPEDIPRFAELGVIASMQAIHMSSDRPWAIDRLGQERITNGAYMWQELLKSGAVVINGTDVPVEPVNPMACFYASVTRKTLAGTPAEGYESAQRMTREQALKSYTLDAAFGAFQEAEKGSIEVGKLADFTVLDQDIMTIPEADILQTRVMHTIVGGEIKYSRK